jgi:hypothetical protein
MELIMRFRQLVEIFDIIMENVGNGVNAVIGME